MGRIYSGLNSKKLIKIVDDLSLNIDLISCICGKKISDGSYRDVYDYNIDDKFVVKICRDGGEANEAEFATWEQVKYFRKDMLYIKNWFAPVEWISPCGRVLVMRKTTSVGSRKLPDKVPYFLTDLGARNFGYIGKQLVAHDYQTVIKDFSKRMKKAYWDY